MASDFDYGYKPEAVRKKVKNLHSKILMMLCAKNYWNWPIFDWVISTTKRWTFFETQCSYTPKSAV